MKIIKLVTFCGIFEVGQQGVVKIDKNLKHEGQYIVFYDPKYKTKEVDVISRDVLVYWG
jgi:ABC-type Zn2+ transport system substrate-binding protein/surface adhesin